MATITKALVVYLPDTRGVVISRYGKGNLKIGQNVYTYSRLPGMAGKYALGLISEGAEADDSFRHSLAGTCPGATEECQSICYARRPVTEGGPVFDMWSKNGAVDVPPIPEDAELLRIHISGDFDSVEYIRNWGKRLGERPDVKTWAYTRSWRVKELLPELERLRELPHMQLFASMDSSTREMPPTGWRRAWIDGDDRAGDVLSISAHSEVAETIKSFQTQRTSDKTKALICPEETKAVKNCEECGFCISRVRNDVIFLKH